MNEAIKDDMDYRSRYEALMEGLGLDPSPEVMDEFPPEALKSTICGLRMSEERLSEECNALALLLREIIDDMEYVAADGQPRAIALPPSLINRAVRLYDDFGLIDPKELC